MRRIPSFLSKNEFYLGLNVSLPVNQWYFCQGGSQAPSTVALTAWTQSLSQAISSSSSLSAQSKFNRSTTGLSLGSLPTRSYAMLGAASAEYSVAYFGFDNSEIMDQFITKYNNFIVEVDQRRRYTLEVSRAWYQPMPSILDNAEYESAEKASKE